MAQEIINVGTLANDGEGDPLRVAFQKVNNNFSSLFSTSFSTTESTTVGLTPNQVILEFPATTFNQGVFQIRSYDPTNTDMQNITLSASIANSNTDVRFSGYGTVFQGNALCGYNMDILSGNVRVLIDPLVDTVINHFVSYQVTAESP